jgi:hypothetical protein
MAARLLAARAFSSQLFAPDLPQTALPALLTLDGLTTYPQ